MNKPTNRIWVTNSFRVYFSHRISNDEKNVMREWCRNNCSGSWKIKPKHVRFYDEADATLFHINFG